MGDATGPLEDFPAAAGPPVNCGNEDHRRPTKAIAKVSYPDGRWKPDTACVGCLQFLVRLALDEGVPILVGPVRGSR